MADDDREEPNAESDERASGPLVKSRSDGDKPVANSYRVYGGDSDEPSANAGFGLHDLLRIAFKRKWVIGGSIVGCLVCGLLWTLLQKPLYTATIRLEITSSAAKILKEGDAAPSESDQFWLETEMELLKSRSLAERVASMTHAAGDWSRRGRLRLRAPESARGAGRSGSERADRERAAAALLLGNLAVKAVPNTRLVDISYTNPDPTRAQRIANAFGDAFIESKLDKRFQANAHAKSFLEDQLKQLKLRLEDAEESPAAVRGKGTDPRHDRQGVDRRQQSRRRQRRARRPYRRAH